MALLNRLFPTKKKNHKQGYVSRRNESVSWKPFNFPKEHARVLLFRECDARGRKLLFDSSSVQKTYLETQQNSKLKFTTKSKCDTFKKTDAYVEITSGYGYQYKKPSSDVTLIGEMVFGSVAMTFRGTTLKVHNMESPERIMCTRVFHAPVMSIHSKQKSEPSLEDSCGSSLSSASDYPGLCSNSESKLGSSGPLDVPYSEVRSRAPASSIEGDSGFCGDASLHSISSISSGGWWGPYQGSLDSPNGSHSNGANSCVSGGSLASLQRRWMHTLSTSLELGNLSSIWPFVNHGSSAKLSGDECVGHKHRKTQLGLTVIITLSSEEEKDMQHFFFEHMAVIESVIQRLQCNVEKAYARKEMFVHLMMEAYHDVQQWLCDICTAPRLPCPVWLGLASSQIYRGCSRTRYSLAMSFLRDLCHLIDTIDTKATNFFISTLVTAVLTHHLGWVATILPAKAPPNSVTKPPCTVQMLHVLARSHPYNALWAQLGDLCGAVGNPVKIARTIVAASGKKNDLLNKLLSSLSYFIRCGNIEKRTENQFVSDDESETLNSILTSLSRSEINPTTSAEVRDTQACQKGDPKCTGPLQNVIKDSKNLILPQISPAACNLGECEHDDSVRSFVTSNPHYLCENTRQMTQLCNETFPCKDNGGKEIGRSSRSNAGLRRTPTFMNKLLNSSSLMATESKENRVPGATHVKKEEMETFLHPDVISKKVSRLCRVPTNALLYHMNAVKSYFPKKVDCERQLTSIERCPAITLHKGKEKSNSASVCGSSSSHLTPEPVETKGGSVVFVLGENEELVDLKLQCDSCLPKSKSDNVLCCDKVCTKKEFCSENCYPSLEGLFHENNASINVPSVAQGIGDKSSEPLKVVPGKSGFLQATHSLDPICRHSFNSEVSSKKTNSCGPSLVISGSENNAILQERKTQTQDACQINKQVRSAKVVTSHSSIIELENENGGNEIKLEVKDQMCKPVMRSQSLSFPVRRDSSSKKVVHVSRRHSEYIHNSERYLKDYRSVRFNFERCGSVLDSYVDRIGCERSPQSDSKSLKLSEARGNFEIQEKLCDEFHKAQDKCDHSVMCSCVDRETNCRGHTQMLQPCKREGNALFDGYGLLSEDEGLSPCDNQKSERTTDPTPTGRTSSDPPELLELPLPRTANLREQDCGLAVSLLGGVSDHYVPDMVLHGCTQPLPKWEAQLKRDLALASHHCILDQDVSEAVGIVGNVDLWEVQIVSSHTSVIDKQGTSATRVGMSQLVGNMLESLLHLWKLRAPPEQCLQHLESKLRELCLRSQALAEFLLTTDFCDMATLTSCLGLEANDVPLLLAIASTHTPQVTCHYGVSFR